MSHAELRPLACLLELVSLVVEKSDMNLEAVRVTFPATGFASSTTGDPASYRENSLKERDAESARDARNERFFRRSAVSATDDTLPNDDFRRHLRREMRRSERSNAALSTVVFHIDTSHVSHATDAHLLLEALHDVTRETDIVGHVGDAAIAVLCLDTGAVGAKAFVQKVKRRLDDVPFETVTATYPDLLFEQLADGSKRLTALAPFLGFEAANGQQGGYPSKRCLDVMLALFAIVAFAPVMLVLAALVAATSRGPVIFSQQRLGKNGIPFTFYKFRSMVIGLDDDLHRNFVTNLIRKGDRGEQRSAGSGPAEYKLTSDPRITGIGKFLRKSSLDELPQLFNVMRGEMSLVGPRPPIPYEAWQYRPWHLRRVLAVKPGITGLWQVEGRSRVSFDEMVRMDLRYIRDCSLALDLRLMLRTVPVVLRCNGAV